MSTVSRRRKGLESPYQMAQREEREAIVAWLRSDLHGPISPDHAHIAHVLRHAADLIEQGAHRG